MKSSQVLVIRHIAGSGLGLLEKFLKQKGVAIRYFDIASGDALAEPVTDYSHLVILGGPISAYEEDKYPFLLHEFALVEKAIAQKIPTVGICLGSQVLARVLGGKVYRGENGREAGWCEVQFKAAAGQDWLFQHFPERLKVFESHQDTFDLPPQCVHLAFSEKYPHQSFRYQNYVWALQFHLELNQQVLQACASVIAKELVESKIQHTTVEQLIEEAGYYAPLVEPYADRLMEQFLQLSSQCFVDG